MSGMMKDILRKRNGTAFLFLVLMLLVSWASAQAHDKSASIVIEPASGKAAAAIKIKGANFHPGEEVDIVMQVGDVYHGLGTEKAEAVLADAKGEFDVSSGIPVRTPPGNYEIEATGNKGSAAKFKIEVLK